MNPLTFINDPRLLVLFLLSALISLLSSTTVATRISAIITKKVAMAFSIFSIFFLITRFANLFYLPYLGIYVDKAEQTRNLAILLSQIRFIVWGAAFGSILAFLLLPTFVEIYKEGIKALEKYNSMVKVLLKLILIPRNWLKVLSALRPPSMMGVKLFNLEGVSGGFLIFNIFATAIWTVGALCAIYASAMHPEFKRTAVLLSGLVNAVAAIFFSLIIDPKASLITDLVVKGERPEKQIYSLSIHLALGTLLGSIIAQLFLLPGAKIIDFTAQVLGSHEIIGNFLLLAGFNAVVMLLASTSYSSRISAVITRNVATAIAIYNFFFLITRLSQQIFAPMIGSIVDTAVKNGNVSNLESQFRWLIGGSTLGAILGLMMMATFVEIYKKAINGMEKYGSLTKLLGKFLITPSYWIKAFTSLRPPSFMGVRLKDLKTIPNNFLIANIIVLSLHTVGVLAATYASAAYPDARGVTLLSSVINGVATILLSIMVDPSTAIITDDAIAGKRPLKHIQATAIFLSIGTIIGTVISQAVFIPATELIKLSSSILSKL